LPADECPPILFIGPVGCGKTETILQVAKSVTPFGTKKKGLVPLVRHLSQVHPLDMGGVGLDNTKREMYYAEPPLFNEWKDNTDEGVKHSVTFLDEIDRAQPIAQSSMLQYLLSREINGYKCKNNYAIAAANGWHAQYTYELDKAAASRFVIMHVEPRKDDWMKWQSRRLTSA
jgi:MoxR-like ATPase